MSSELAFETDAWHVLQSGPDADAFATVFRNHNKAVYNYCFRRLASWVVAEDATQATFMALWRRACQHHVEPLREGSERAVLLAMARQECLTVARAVGRRDRLTRKVTAQPPPPAPLTSEQWIDAEVTMHQINEALAHLPANQRDVIELVCWCGLSVREAAATLRVAEGTVKSRLSRARAKLHESDLAALLGGAR